MGYRTIPAPKVCVRCAYVATASWAVLGSAIGGAGALAAVDAMVD